MDSRFPSGSNPPPSRPTPFSSAQGDGANSLVLGLNNGVPYADVTVPAGTQRTAPGDALVVGVWRHLAVTVTADRRPPSILDGKPYGTPLGAGLPALAGPLQLGVAATGRSRRHPGIGRRNRRAAPLPRSPAARRGSNSPRSPRGRMPGRPSLSARIEAADPGRLSPGSAAPHVALRGNLQVAHLRRLGGHLPLRPARPRRPGRRRRQTALSQQN